MLILLWLHREMNVWSFVTICAPSGCKGYWVLLILGQKGGVVIVVRARDPQVSHRSVAWVGILDSASCMGLVCRWFNSCPCSALVFSMLAWFSPFTKTKTPVPYSFSMQEHFFLGPVYMEKNCPGWKGHLPSRATLDEPTFHSFPYKTWRTIYMRKKMLARLEGWPA